jgi:hypothetical protein
MARCNLAAFVCVGDAENHGFAAIVLAARLYGPDVPCRRFAGGKEMEASRGHDGAPAYGASSANDDEHSGQGTVCLRQRFLLSRMSGDGGAGVSLPGSIAFLRNLFLACLLRIQKILTNNGTQFTDRFTSRRPSGAHAFD